MMSLNISLCHATFVLSVGGTARAIIPFAALTNYAGMSVVSGESITWNEREHYINKAQHNAKPGLEEYDDHIRKLAMSFPRKNRRKGSNAFNSRGELKPHYPRYLIIQELLLKHKLRSEARTPASIPLRRSNRKRSKVFRLPPPFFSIKSGPAKPAIAADNGFTEFCTNLYGPAFYNPEQPSRRPECWPKDWAWPQSPTYIPEDENPCDYCEIGSNEGACDCITQKMEARGRLSARLCKEKGKGKGVFATAREIDKKPKWKCVSNKDGKIRVYKGGAILMPLTGTLVPDHREYNDGWSAEIRRDDLPEAPVLGRIYCRYTGNVVRDIYDDEEITVDYGPDYFTKENPCLCGSEKCVFRKQDVKRDTGNSNSTVAGQKRKAMRFEPMTSEPASDGK
ncbi:hypothetical protein V490_07559 [Pseudogymnoascus sp. VKM F-3557]|nr:hypothetical protein V490_07559 [Pseudogymnoascus sp. VKM F-3557]